MNDDIEKLRKAEELLENALKAHREKDDTVVDRETGKKNLVSFSIAALLNDTGTEMYRPFIPIYVVTFLYANPLIFSIIISLEELFNRAFKLVTGVISDRVGRKKGVGYGYLLISTERFGLAFAPIWHLVIPFLSLRQFGRAIRDPAREASIAESIPKSDRGKAFGTLNAMDTIGAIIGPVLGFIAISYFTYGSINLFGPFQRQGAYQYMFLLAAVPTLLSMLVIFIYLRETWHGKKDVDGFSSTFKKGLAIYRRSKALRHYTIANCIMALGAVPVIMYIAFIQVGHLRGTLTDTVYLSIVYTSFLAVFSYPSGFFVDRIGRKYAQITAMLLCSLSLIFMAIATTVPYTIPGFALFGIYEAIWITSRRAVISDAAPPEFRAQALGTFSTFYGLSLFFTPLIFGLLWVYAGSMAAFMVCAMFSLASALYVSVVMD